MEGLGDLSPSISSVVSVTSLVSRTVSVGLARTTIRFEQDLWDALDDVCRRERCSRSEIIHRAMPTVMIGSRTSALRVFLFRYFKAATTDEGHKAAGHGGLVMKQK